MMPVHDFTLHPLYPLHCAGADAPGATATNHRPWMRLRCPRGSADVILAFTTPSTFSVFKLLLVHRVLMPYSFNYG